MERAGALIAVVSMMLWFSGAGAGCGRSGCGAAVLGESNTTPKECTGLPPLASKAAYTVGFVQIYEPSNAYTIANTKDFVGEAKKRDYHLVYNPPTTPDPAEQASRVQALIDAKVDAIVMKPVGASASVAPTVIAARKACIPVFTESRFFDHAQAAPGTDIVTHIGTDPVLQGQSIGDWLIKATHGKAAIIELEGTSGASSSIGRKKGFDEQIASQPGMKIVASQPANFDRTMGHDVAKQLLGQFPTASVIYAHNDAMALGALAATKDIGRVPGKDVLIVSIDGFKEAVQYVIDGAIAAIAFNSPKLAGVSFDTLEKYAAGERIPDRVVVRGPVIDRTNATAMMSEAF
jgi:ribose transport system substrate-binding protein